MFALGHYWTFAQGSTDVFSLLESSRINDVIQNYDDEASNQHQKINSILPSKDKVESYRRVDAKRNEKQETKPQKKNSDFSIEAILNLRRPSHKQDPPSEKGILSSKLMSSLRDENEQKEQSVYDKETKKRYLASRKRASSSLNNEEQLLRHKRIRIEQSFPIVLTKTVPTNEKDYTTAFTNSADLTFFMRKPFYPRLFSSAVVKPHSDCSRNRTNFSDLFLCHPFSVRSTF